MNERKRQRLGEFALGVLNPSLVNSISGKIPFDGPGDFNGWLKTEVESGRLKLITITRKGEPVGGIVYDMKEAGEVVIVALAGLNNYDGLTPEIDNLCNALADKLNARTITIHTQRAIIAETAMKNGYHVSEVILRKEV